MRQRKLKSKHPILYYLPLELLEDLEKVYNCEDNLLCKKQ